jgi:hypothetical protein
VNLYTHKSESPAATGLNATFQKSQSQFSAKSCATEAQHERILLLLRQRSHTSHELRCKGIYQVSTRIKELREMGFDIQTHRVNLVDHDGYWHPRCALYSLIEGKE